MFEPHLFRRRLAKPSSKLRNYLFVDHTTLDSYVEQLGGLPARRRKKRSVGASMTGIDAKLEMEETSDPQFTSDKIEFLLDCLDQRHNLLRRRPARLPPAWNAPSDFVHEFCTAKSYILPASALSPDLGLKALRIWVSEPDEKDFSDQPFVWTGTYLFLTELHFDDLRYHSLYSGCSALRFLLNYAQGRESIYRSGEEILGRFDDRTIDAKLSSFGALSSDARQIEVLYRTRYMTNEQLHKSGSVSRRVHDLLGYPIFISALS